MKNRKDTLCPKCPNQKCICRDCKGVANDCGEGRRGGCGFLNYDGCFWYEDNVEGGKP
jgi:hypothetical protein